MKLRRLLFPVMLLLAGCNGPAPPIDVEILRTMQRAADNANRALVISVSVGVFCLASILFIVYPIDKRKAQALACAFPQADHACTMAATTRRSSAGASSRKTSNANCPSQ